MKYLAVSIRLSAVSLWLLALAAPCYGQAVAIPSAPRPGDKGDITISPAQVWTLDGKPSGAIVGTTDAQTLANKTLSSPTINGTPTIGDSSAWRGAIGVDQGNAPIVRISSLGVKTAYGVGAANSTAMGTALASAVAAMVAGDTVTVNGPATYTIAASLNPPAGTSLIGIGKPLIAASGTTDATIIVDNNDILVRGFSIETNLLGVGKLTATPLTISGVVIDDVDVSITSTQGSGIQWSQSIGGGTTEHTVDAQIRNCNLGSGSMTGFGLFAYLAAGSNLYIYDTNTNGETDGILVGGSSGAECFVFGGEHLSTLDAITSGGPPIRIVGARLRGNQADAYSDGGPVYLHGCDHRYTSDAGSQTYEIIGGQALQLISQARPVIPIAMGGTNGATAAEARTNLGVSVRTIQIAPFGVDGATATGDGKWRYRVPASMNGAVITAVNLNLQDDSSSGAVDFDVARDRGGSVVDVLSTNLTVDATEFDSSTAAAAVINAANDDLATGDILRVDCDGAGTGAKGPLLTIEVTK